MNNFLRTAIMLATLGAIEDAHADNWPSRLIKPTIPFGAGSATGVVPRLVFDRLAAELGQPIVIEKRGRRRWHARHRAGREGGA
jgi:tripartite-type tricarboxylate transporter receptor subunit TctC